MTFMTRAIIGRYAPSPSGRMHIGNIFSCLISYVLTHQQAHREGLPACMRLRIEDLDPSRSKQCYIDQIMRDLSWFGFTWDGEVVYQSQRTEAYQTAFKYLVDTGWIYPCYCSRADLHSAQAPHRGEEVLYAGTCRPDTKHATQSIYQTQCNAYALQSCKASFAQNDRTIRKPPAYRFRIPVQTPVMFQDYFQGEQTITLEAPGDDFIVRRSDGVFAYQLAVVLDDALQDVTTIVRGEDLLSSTAKQIYIRQILDNHCAYDGSQQFSFNPGVSQCDRMHFGHVPLFVDETGRRLSKRNHDASLAYLIDDKNLGSKEILGLLAYLSGIIPVFEPLTLDQLVEYADLSALYGKTKLMWPRAL